MRSKRFGQVITWQQRRSTGDIRSEQADDGRTDPSIQPETMNDCWFHASCHALRT